MGIEIGFEAKEVVFSARGRIMKTRRKSLSSINLRVLVFFYHSSNEMERTSRAKRFF